MRMPRHDGKSWRGFLLGGRGACGIFNIAAATTADDRPNYNRAMPESFYPDSESVWTGGSSGIGRHSHRGVVAESKVSSFTPPLATALAAGSFKP